jgi:hypothetical protein
VLFCRLENGLHKLHKTQSEVDVLVENARAMALEVEQKVANANVFAEQVRPVGESLANLPSWHRMQCAGTLVCRERLAAAALTMGLCC